MSGSSWRPAIAVIIGSATLAANASAAVRPVCFAESKKATAKRHKGKPLPPLAIVDSIMRPSVPQLGCAGWDADARVCRSFDDARRMIRVRKSHRTLPRVARNRAAWFDEDGVHLDAKAGIRAYTRLITSAYRRGDARLGGGAADAVAQPARADSGTT